MAATIESVCALLLPVRGNEETILIGPTSWLGVGTGAAPTGSASGDAPGEAGGTTT
jgi:hypothetical protein